VISLATPVKANIDITRYVNSLKVTFSGYFHNLKKYFAEKLKLLSLQQNSAIFIPKIYQKQFINAFKFKPL